jgi:hypothetical protein
MSIGAKKTKIEKVVEKDVLVSLTKEKAKALNDIINTSNVSTLRKPVYLSSGGKYSKYVDFLLKFTYDLGNVPIHPILTLNYYISTISHQNKKDEIVRDCFSLINQCEELWVFEEKLPYFKSMEASSDRKNIAEFPEGVLAEILWWLRYKKGAPIRFFTWRDVGIPKYLYEEKWQLAPDQINSEKESVRLSNHFGIIDLGSSTVKLSVSEIDEFNKISVILKKSITTNLAEDFFQTDLIKEEAKDRTIEGLKDLKDEAINNGVTDFKLIATKVLRDAKNAREVVGEIEAETGLKLEVLSKEQESRYVAKAVLESFDKKDRDLIVINAGGGSTQVTFSVKGTLQEYSLSIGISDLNEKFLTHYPIKDVDYNSMKEFIKSNILDNIKEIPQIDTLVYTGGELDYMLITGFPLDDFKGSMSHPKQINKKNYKMYSAKMREMALEEIQAFMPNNPNWMNGAIASNTLLEVLSDVFKIKTIIPSNKNVNDGILLTMK